MRPRDDERLDQPVSGVRTTLSEQSSERVGLFMALLVSELGGAEGSAERERSGIERDELAKRAKAIRHFGADCEARALLVEDEIAFEFCVFFFFGSFSLKIVI